MFQQGLIGLNAATKSLDVIGNNIANASTVGFKSSEAQFADLYANSLNGVSGNMAGIGVSVARLAQQFTQGNIETTNNPLDISINGGGFFRMVQDGAVQYSRNGQFLLDKTGTLVNAQGAQVTGYLANKDGVILSGAPVPIQIDTSDLAPVQTTKANFKINLSSDQSKEPVPTTIPFNANDPTSYNKQSVLPVYDSLGNEHTMSVYYVRTAGGTWDVYVGNDGTQAQAKEVMQTILTNPAVIAARQEYQDAVDAGDVAVIDAERLEYSATVGQAVTDAATLAGASPATLARIALLYTPGTDVGEDTANNPDMIDAKFAAAVEVPAVKVTTLIFNKNGAIDAAAMLAAGNSLPVTVDLPIFPDNGAVLDIPIDLSFNGTTQYGSATSEKLNEQDGYSSGSLTRFAADANGVIMGQYSNGKSRPLAQLVLADFASVDGLTPLGNNAWAESSASGVPQVGVPGEGGMGLMRSSSVEASNVDLTEQLVDMITAQRVYQANAQTIKTEDSVLQTLVNLR